ncbi:MAG: Coenzyme F420 hydrogenase/dehydrogenase, beta subunit C-terminal domain [Muribaculaceae bacterium]|nr:Coenzyme F420 hydrogenase/dehydrogenase, beta subunit C-terminal domain [Muribaculaceae bacterium]
MIRTCDYDICTGCLACETACPVKCISPITREFGHIYPRINTKQCIDCKNCEKVCPALASTSPKLPEKAYAALHCDYNIYESSSSGGAAAAMSQTALRMGFIVYGAASLPQGEVSHIRIDKIEEIEKLQGSKYVQSDLSTALTALKEDVTRLNVLFIGTPCQCAAARRIAGKHIDKLTTVELICHGVPSSKFFLKYLKRKGINLEEIKKVQFRTEEGFQIKVKDFEGTTIYKSSPYFQNPDSDLYYSTFLNGFSYRKSCYTCKYAQPKRYSDITIGDFWGLGKKIPSSEIPPHKKGISLVLPSTKKGIEFLRKCDSLALFERPIEEAIEGNTQLRHPTKYSWRVKLFNTLRKMLGVSIAFKLSVFDRKFRNYFRK